ncbi:reductase [Colletotrichum orchidophilum]|uniref:Reductase n=1 Tax=Colletotrichum orchidophilum TaxID=1209926 RepID=A0A1G4B334_9PEZI|nr:reductase [Colletotrichum orchidophilum]OHE95838.1 reductase [Colletotrichum orchidophilum]
MSASTQRPNGVRTPCPVTQAPQVSWATRPSSPPSKPAFAFAAPSDQTPASTYVILAAPSIRNNTPAGDQLSWTIVPNISIPGAYDKAAHDVDYIFHCASPEPFFGKDGCVGTEEEIYVRPAVAVVIGLLESARRHAAGTLRRVVVESWIVAIIPMLCFTRQGLDRPASDGESRVATPPAPCRSGFGVYRASNIAALNASEAWMKVHNPKVNLVSIIPAWLWSETPILSVEDVATAHVCVLSPSVSGKQSFYRDRHVAVE